MLSDYRVLDLTDERGHLAGLMWAQLGAEVIAVEPSGGSPARRLAPFAGDVEDAERSLHHWAYNRGKRSIVLDLDTDDGRDALRRLAAGADVLFTTDPAGLAARGLRYDDLSALNPGLIYTTITAFGLDGPKAGWAAADLVIQASAGNMAITGDRDRAPLRAGGTLPQAWHNAASEAAGAALIALYERQTRSGLGQLVDASAQQSMNQACQSMTLAGPLNATPTTRIAGGASLQGIPIQLMWPCKDGHASVTFLFGAGFARFTRNLMEWIHEEGMCDEATRDKDWIQYPFMLLDGREPVEEYERVKQVLTDFFATKTKAELLEAAMKRRLLITPVWTTAEVLDSPQLAFRQYWEDVDHGGEVGTVRYPGPFAKFSAAPCPVLPPAPSLGADTEAVLAEPARTPKVAVKPSVPSAARPLEGVKIVDFMWAMAGPAASRVLADYGAEIIRVESANKIDAVRTLQPFRDDVTDPELSGIWNNMNAGKQGLALDMSKPGALDVIWDLFDWADVIMESFSPRAMAAWGIDYEQVRKRRPDIIMTSSCLMGQTGPLSMLAGFGTMAAAISGFFYPVGWPDRAPAGPFGAYTDYTSPRWLVAAVMAALEHKRATGQGQYIDLSQAESALHLLAPALLDRSVNGRIWERNGNRDLVFAPQGVYRCTGDDNWVAIACTSDDVWATLADVIGRADLAGLSRAERHSRHDELDSAIAAWTAGQHYMDAMHRLQGQGVPAHVVANAPEFLVDPQIAHRQHFVEVGHAKQGTTVVEGTRFKLSRTPAAFTYGAPTFGEHSFEILTGTLGYDGDRIAELAAAELLE